MAAANTLIKKFIRSLLLKNCQKPLATCHFAISRSENQQVVLDGNAAATPDDSSDGPVLVAWTRCSPNNDERRPKGFAVESPMVAKLRNNFPRG